MNSKKKYIFSILLICILFGASINTPLAAAINCDVRVTGATSKSDTASIKRFFRMTDFIVSKILPSGKNTPLAYSVDLLDPDSFQKPKIEHNREDGVFHVFLSNDLSSWINKHNLISNLIASVILAKSGISKPSEYKKVPAWLLHAIIKKIIRRNDAATIPGMVDYPGLHALILSQNKIDWLSIVENPIPQKESGAYQIYLEASEVITDSILRLPGGRKLLINMLELSSKGYDKQTFFVEALTKKLNNIKDRLKGIHPTGTENILTVWINYNFALAALNVLTPANATMAERLFKESEVLMYHTKKGEERYCKLIDLPDKIKEIKNLQVVIVRKQRSLAIAAFKMPVLLQKYLYQVEDSLDLIKNKKTKEFSAKYKNIRQEFFKELEREYMLEVYMIKSEHKFVPPGYRLHNELRILEAMQKEEKNYCPALYQFMDTQNQ